MKNRIVKGLVIVMLIAGLALSACDTTTGGGSNNTTGGGDETSQTPKFEGTWKHITTEVDFRYIFTGNSFISTADGETTRVGTFTFTDTTITFDCG
jgi:predicted small secreted protein